MNEETKNFLNDVKFDTLYVELFSKHKPRKAEFKKEALEAIGYLITRFQRLEHTIKFFVGLLVNIANDQPLIHALLSKHSFSNLLLVLERIAIQKGFHRMEELKFLIKKAGKAEEIRNQLVHSVWISGGRFKTTLKSGKGVHHANETYSSEELSQIAEMIDKIDTAIDAIQFDYIQHCHEKGMNINGVKYI